MNKWMFVSGLVTLTLEVLGILAYLSLTLELDWLTTDFIMKASLVTVIIVTNIIAVIFVLVGAFSNQSKKEVAKI